MMILLIEPIVSVRLLCCLYKLYMSERCDDLTRLPLTEAVWTSSLPPLLYQIKY